ncbi:MAG: ParA family protein [Solirubrobacteraceae bacterium]
MFVNQKGGVGKTTVALGIAAELAARAARVLLIDLDPPASATKVLGIDVDARWPTRCSNQIASRCATRSWPPSSQQL